MTSPPLECKRIAEKLIKSGEKVYNFGLGQNPLQPPQKYVDLVKKNAHMKNYGSCEGVPVLNSYLKSLYKTDNIIVGNGLKELLFIAQLSHSDKIIHITPTWVGYREQIILLGKQKNLIEIETNYLDNFKITPEKLEKHLDHQSDTLILFNNPHNPTGVIYSKQELAQLADVIKKYPKCIVLADEIYLNLQDKTCSISKFIPDQTVIGSSVSKDLSCGGYRIGWLAFPKEKYDFFNKCLENSSKIYSCAPVPLQYATGEMLTNNEQLCHDYFEYNYKTHSRVTAKMISILENTKLICSKNECTWYCLVSFKNYEKELKKLAILNSNDLAKYLIENLKIVTVPGSCFGTNDNLSLRFSFVDFDHKLDTKHMMQGLTTLNSFLSNLLTTSNSLL